MTHTCNYRVVRPLADLIEVDFVELKCFSNDYSILEIFFWEKRETYQRIIGDCPK